MTRIIHAIASWCQTTAGFLAINLSWLLWIAAGVLVGFNDTFMLYLTLFLSVLAIVLTTSILVTQREENEEAKRKDEAMHAKLDALLVHLPDAPSEMAGIEKGV